MRSPLTEMQAEVYKHLIEFMRENGYSPTIREVQAKFRFRSTNSVVMHLNNLRDKGYITKSSTKSNMKSRTIRLVDDIVGNYTIDGTFLSKALKQLKERGYALDHNTAVEFLNELKVNIV